MPPKHSNPPIVSGTSTRTDQGKGTTKPQLVEELLEVSGDVFTHLITVLSVSSGMVGVCLTAIEEIFDVQILAGLRFPEVIGFQKETVDHTFVVPPADR